MITFENKTNYLDFIRKTARPDTLGIYLAGFHSPVKRLFLQKVTAFLRENAPSGVAYFHWGDIDLGGFRIFVHLKTEVLPELRPYRMDAETLRRYRDYADPLEPAYARELGRLLERPEYSDFHETIREMLKIGLRLEQEAILIEP